jgi:hypothetical protein
LCDLRAVTIDCETPLGSQGRATCSKSDDERADNLVENNFRQIFVTFILSIFAQKQN